MTALDIERMTDFGGLVPGRGTYPIKANVRIFKGAQVGLDSVGRAMPGDTIANGCLVIVGKSSATYDNRTGSALGGGAAACYVEVEFGVHHWATAGGGDTIAADDVGKVCFVVDDQTVALTNGTDTRAIAGLITEVVDGEPYVWQGPHVAAILVIAASEASQLDTAQTEIDALQADVLALEVDATTAQATWPIPLGSFFDADGDPLAKFVNEGAPSCGFSLVESEAFGIRWNNDATPGTITTSIPLPQDLDDTAAVVVHYLASKVGATGGDLPKFTTGAFFQTVGATYIADVDAGGDSSAMTNPATKTTQEVTLSIAAGDVPASPSVLTLTVAPKAGTLGTDDLVLHGIWLEYTRKEMTS